MNGQKTHLVKRVTNLRRGKSFLHVFHFEKSDVFNLFNVSDNAFGYVWVWSLSGWLRRVRVEER